LATWLFAVFPTENVAYSPGDRTGTLDGELVGADVGDGSAVAVSAGAVGDWVGAVSMTVCDSRRLPGARIDAENG